jgi:integrase
MKELTQPKTQKQQTKNKSKGKDSDRSRYIKTARLGKVTIYRRGKNYWLYFRDGGRSIRKKVDGNLATARATASQVNVHLEQGHTSPFSFQTKPVTQTVRDFIEHCKDVRGLRIRSVRRYKAALDHFLEFVNTKPHLNNIDQVKEATVDEFVRWMRKKERVRSGEKNGNKDKYKTSGIVFILSTCRTLFNYARKCRLLSPYEDNPFSIFPVEKMRNRQTSSSVDLLNSSELSEFFKACDNWQFSLFFILSLYGLRAGELAHLLISDVDLNGERFFIRPKPLMFWYVKTNRERILPVIPQVKPLFERLINNRKEGFLFLSRLHTESRRETYKFDSREKMESTILSMVDELKAGKSALSDEELFNITKRILHKLGKVREDKIRLEFMDVAAKIGRSDVTMVHSLRHMFATLAEENGLNPLTVQTILGHSRLEMTRYYTHTGLEAKKTAVQDLLQGKNGLEQILSGRLASKEALSDGMSAGTGISG